MHQPPGASTVVERCPWQAHPKTLARRSMIVGKGVAPRRARREQPSPPPGFNEYATTCDVLIGGSHVTAKSGARRLVQKAGVLEYVRLMLIRRIVRPVRRNMRSDRCNIRPGSHPAG